jgi:hypothetical protein
VTANGVPLPDLTQPAAVSLLAFTRMYGLPRPSVTCRVTSSPMGALSISFQLPEAAALRFSQSERWRQYLPRRASIQDGRLMAEAQWVSD